MTAGRTEEPVSGGAAAAVAEVEATEAAGGATVLRWLERPCRQGVTWGVPWPRGAVRPGVPFALADGTPVQSWTTATWPDGSVKWSAHAIGPQAVPAGSYELVPGAEPAAPGEPVTVARDGGGLRIATGPVAWTLPGAGGTDLIASVAHGGTEIVRGVRLVSLRQDTADEDGSRVRVPAAGVVSAVAVEQDGPVRAVVRLEGRHVEEGGRSWLPFTVRLYFYAGAADVRVVHSFVWDGDASADFLAGLGLRAEVAMRDAPHDRHVRLAGAEGFLTEAVRGLTGLRRDPGEAVRRAQTEGRPVGEIGNPEVAGRLHLIPLWNDHTLEQHSADGFTLRKRTAPGHAWVTVPAGTRSKGYGYVGGVSGGLGFGLRDFWRLHPTRLDVRGAATETATATVWLWSPGAPPMDLRFWHDGMGQDTHAEQLEGLEITYEDHEPGFGDPHGVARTHELTLRVHPATPPAAELAEHAALLEAPRPAHRRARAAARGGCVRRLVAAGPVGSGRRGDRGPAGLPVRLLRAPARGAPVVRVLGLRRRHARLRSGPAHLALRRGRLRLGQLRALAGPVAVVPVPAHRALRRLPVRRGDDPAHRRGGRVPPGLVEGAGVPAQRAALGVQLQAAARLQRRLPALPPLPDRRRAHRGPARRARRARGDVPGRRPAAQGPPGRLHPRPRRAGGGARRGLGGRWPPPG